MTAEATTFFYSLTPDRILNAVERLGVRCTGRILQLNSMENRVYEVEIEVADETSRYDRFRVVKFYRPGRWSKEQILEEHEFLRDLSANDIAVAKPLPFPDDGSTVADLEGTGIWYAVFPKAGGRILDELQEDQLKRIGRLIARLHSTGASRPCRQRLELTPKTYGWDNISYLSGCGLVPSEVLPYYVQLAEVLCRDAEVKFQNVPLQRLHGDLHCGNVLWDRDTCILVDFDDMVKGPCVQDLWLLVPGRDELSKKNFEALLGGYEQMKSFNYHERALIEPLRSLRMIHFSAWIAKRYEDPAFQRVFPQFRSMEYWRGELAALQEQVELLQGGA